MHPTMTTPGIVYLLCLSVPLGNRENPRAQASHYIGFAETDRFHARIAEHRAGRGAAITRAAVGRGIAIEVARTWSATMSFEKALKALKRAPCLCPRCCGSRGLRRPLAIEPVEQRVLMLEEVNEHYLLEDFPPAPKARADWFEIETQREWRAASASLAVPSGHLDDDLL